MIAAATPPSAQPAYIDAGADLECQRGYEAVRRDLINRPRMHRVKPQVEDLERDFETFGLSSSFSYSFLKPSHPAYPAVIHLTMAEHRDGELSWEFVGCGWGDADAFKSMMINRFGVPAWSIEAHGHP